MLDGLIAPKSMHNNGSNIFKTLCALSNTKVLFKVTPLYIQRLIIYFLAFFVEWWLMYLYKKKAAPFSARLESATDLNIS
jgi:hypothetical protein